MYENATQLAQQGTNRQQADNERRKRSQANYAQQGQYPYAAQGSAEAQQSGAAADGARATNMQRDLRSQQAQQPMTFAQMQQQGYARPAPPQPPAPGTPQSPGMGPNGQAPLMQALTGMAPQVQMLGQGGQPLPNPGTPVPTSGTQGTQPPAQPTPQPMQQGGQSWTTPGSPQLQQALSQMLANPNAYRSQDTLTAYDQLGQRIDDQFNQQVTGINEEMARRGIYDSSIAGGRLYDSSVARKDAKTQLAESLGRSQAEQENQARQAALGLGLQDQGQRFQQALGQGSLDIQNQNLGLSREQMGLDDRYRNRALDQNESQFSRNFGEGQRQFDLGQTFDYSALEQSGMLGLMGMLGFDVTGYGAPAGMPVLMGD